MPLNLRSKPKITSNFNTSSKSKRPNLSISNHTSKSPSKSAQNRHNREKSAQNRTSDDYTNRNYSFLAPEGRNSSRSRERYDSEDDFDSRNRTRSGGRQWERKNNRSNDNREFGNESDRKSNQIVREKERVGLDRDRRRNGREFDERDRILRGKEQAGFDRDRKRVDKGFYDEDYGGKEGRKVRERVVWKKGVEVRCEESEEEEVEEVVEEKREKFQSRVLDKTGRKVRVNRKEEGSSSVEGSERAKKKKRVIKIDPYDFSNKRLDDSPIAENEKIIEKKQEMSMNAQFRAIQPSPEFLSFVEENLLGRRRLIELQNAGYNTKISAPLDNVPFSESKERERIEDNVFRNKLEFFAAAKISSSFPPPVLPEIAFPGRSNVGKSSLLNALTRQWGVVRTSDKPGLTQTINFFRLASKLSLVDLPGYGFAYAKEEVKDAWEELVKEYVSTRVGLQQVCLLIDTKWGMKARDHELVELMERSKTPYQIVLTKTDLVFPIDVARRAMQIQQDLKSNKSLINPVTMVSSKSGAGIRNLRGVLSKLARFVKP